MYKAALLASEDYSIHLSHGVWEYGYPGYYRHALVLPVEMVISD